MSRLLKKARVCFAAYGVLLLTMQYGRTIETAASTDLEGRAAAYFEAYHEVGDFNGVALIADGEHILFSKIFSPNSVRYDRQTAFRIASLSKTFTAGAIEMLIEDGKVGLKDPLNKYIPDFPGGDKILIVHLLSHMSGVGQLPPEMSASCHSNEELVRALKAAKPLFEPGTSEHYSNEGYVLLAAVIEKVSGKSYAEFTRERIFAPLSMKRSGTMCQEWPVKKHVTGSIADLPGVPTPIPFEQAGWDGPGSIYSTADDLLLWMKALRGNHLMRFDKLPYPYGWGRRNYSGKKLVEQTGELHGYTSHIALYLDQELYFVMLNSVESGMFNRTPKDFEALMFGGPFSTPPSATRAQIPTLEEYAGSYKSDFPYTFHVTAKDGKLWSHWGDDLYLRPIEPTARDEFFERADYCRISFHRTQDGKIDKLTLDFASGEPMIMEASRGNR